MWELEKRKTLTNMTWKQSSWKSLSTCYQKMQGTAFKVQKVSYVSLLIMIWEVRLTTVRPKISLKQYHMYKSGQKCISKEKHKHRAIMEWYFPEYSPTLDLCLKDFINTHCFYSKSQGIFFFFSHKLTVLPRNSISF